MTEKHHLLTNDEFEEKFASCTLPETYFTHEAHLRLAYIHIKKYGIEKAVDNICKSISCFDDKYGDGNKFNKTLTIASLKVMNHFMQKTKAIDFKGLITEFPKLKSNFLGLLKKHYSRDIFTDENAKQEYLEPDLLAFS